MRVPSKRGLLTKPFHDRPYDYSSWTVTVAEERHVLLNQ